MKTLTNITTQYSKFTDNQVLTERQLNEFLDYFEDQHHLSRIALSGVGIVCGFRLTFDATSNKISISKGYGVTTDGDLLTLTEPKTTDKNETRENGLQLIENAVKTYTHYRVFDDNKANYKPFIAASQTQIELLEIFPKEEIDTSNELYQSLSDIKDLKDKVALLYLENYAKEGDLCTALDCDNQGIEQIARLRILLVSSNAALSMASQDSILSENSVEDYLELQEIAVRRDILTDISTKDYQSLKQRYVSLITDETIKPLEENLDIILKKFNKNTISGKISSLLKMNSSAISSDFQYRYDVLKDLVDTYAEIKDLLFSLNVLCCPDIGAFPKHLLLGRLNESDEQFKSLRHNFYKSPVIGHEDDSLQKVKSLLNRVEYLVSNYLKESKGSEIKITPSQAHGVLSNKAIPFYYNVNENLLNHWSFGKYKNFVQTSNLSYHTANLSPALSVQNPLEYTLDNFNFLRIEGVQGKTYAKALAKVSEIKEDYGLSFDVKTLSVNATSKTVDINDYQCQFEDLSILLKAWRTEQNCILAEMSQFFSGFSTKEVGVNVVAREGGYDLRVMVPVQETKEIELLNDKIKILERQLLKDSKKIGKSPISDTDNLKIEEFKKLQDNELYAQKVYENKNVVKDHLTTDDNTLGKYLAASIAKNEEGSANDIFADFKNRTKGITASEIWKEDVSLTTFIFEDIAKALVYSYVLDNRIPLTLREVDNATLSRYKLTIDELCQRVKSLQTKYQSTEIEEGAKQILGLLINQMANVCCSGKKLEILLEEIEKRKSDILKQIQLSEFVKKHPGLRHQAGVPIGGTFVMAYLTGDATDQLTYETVRLELNFQSQPNIEESKETNGGFIKLWDSRASTDFEFVNERKKFIDIRNRLTKKSKFTAVGIGETLKETVSNLADFFNHTWRVAGFTKNCKATAIKNTLVIELIDQPIRKNENYIEFSDLGLFEKSNRMKYIFKKDRRIYFGENESITGNSTGKNTVIADFALPYMCCSDCTPINFIVPREPISLSLPEDSICLEKGSKPLTFTVSPKDGEVKAVVEDGVNGGVIQNNKGEYQFDATVLDPSLYGKTIEFTVNGQETKARIIVNIKATAEVSTSVRYNKAKKSATVTYKVNAENVLDSTKFTWDFGDGNTVDKTPDANNEVVENYELPVNAENILKPTLIISNGACKSPIEIEPITFEASDVEFKIEGSPFCIDPTKKETLKIPFDLKPDTAKLEVNGGLKGITVEGRELLVDPSIFTAYSTPIGFIVAGKAMATPTISIINKSDVANFTWKPDNPSAKMGTETVKVIFEITGLTNQQKKEYGFKWDFGDRASSDDNDLQQTYDISDRKVGEAVFPVVLVIEGGPCGAIEISKDVTITITEEDVDVDVSRNCVDLVSEAIKKDSTALSANVRLSESLKKSIVRRTIALYAEINNNNISEYLKGSKNNTLNNLFNELIQGTANAIVKNKDNTLVKGILSNFFKAQIRLFYNILHCQTEDVIKESMDNNIKPVIDVIEAALIHLKNNRIIFDIPSSRSIRSKGTLIQFLKDFMTDPKAPEIIKLGMSKLINLIIPV